MPTEIQSCLVSLLQDLQTILDTVQWTSLFHRIIPSCWFGQTSLAITWSVVGCRLLTVLSNILPWPFSAPPSGAGNHHSFLPELQVLGLPPVVVAAKLECQPIQDSSGSRHRPRLPETSIYYLSLIRDKLLPPLVLLLAREFFILGPKTVVGTTDKIWPRKIKAEGGEEREMRGFRGRIWRSLKTGVPHWASMRYSVLLPSRISVTPSLFFCMSWACPGGRAFSFILL